MQKGQVRIYTYLFTVVARSCSPLEAYEERKNRGYIQLLKLEAPSPSVKHSGKRSRCNSTPSSSFSSSSSISPVSFLSMLLLISVSLYSFLRFSLDQSLFVLLLSFFFFFKLIYLDIILIFS